MRLSMRSLWVAANFNNDSILIRMLDCIRQGIHQFAIRHSVLNGGLMQSPKRLPLSALLRSHSGSNCPKGPHANYSRGRERGRLEGTARCRDLLLIAWQTANNFSAYKHAELIARHRTLPICIVKISVMSWKLGRNIIDIDENFQQDKKQVEA